MLAGVYRVFGLANGDAARAVQAGISLLTVVLIYRMGVITYGRSVAVWAAAFCGLYPPLLAYANLLLSETLFTFLVVAFCWLACEAFARQRLSLLAAAGIAAGLAALTRSILLLFMPVFALYLLVAWQGRWKQRLMAAALPVAMFAAVIAPWSIRNTRVQQTLTFIDVMGGRNAMMGNSYRQATQGQRDKLALSHAMHFMSTHPWLTAQRSLVKFFNYWQLERMLPAAAQQGYFGELSLLTKLSVTAIVCGSYAALLFAAVFGVCCTPPGNWRVHLFLLANVLFPCAVHSIIFAHSRYNLPTMPLLCIYAAAAVLNWRDIWSRRRSMTFVLAALLCLVFALGWVREFLFVDYGSLTS
jgi:4-amino-4-deoxy-L-arabinose transferase-like glycosyltransferase